MTSQLPDTITVAKAIPSRIYDDHGSVVVGSSYVDDQGRWVVQLGLMEPTGHRDIDVVEGDTFAFAGATWRVTRVPEPTTATRGSVATLTRVAASGG